MKKTSILFAIIVLATFVSCNNQDAIHRVSTDEPTKNYIQYVNPIIGTNGMGHTFPGACAPFGIVQLSPDTDTIPHNIDGEYQPRVYEYCAGYQHKDSTIVGFSHTHFNCTMPKGAQAPGKVCPMPLVPMIGLTYWM